MAATADKGIWEDAKAFRRRVRLPAAQVAALAPGELEAALAYEVEPFSGVPASAAEVAWREEESADRSVRTYDVAVRARARRAGRAGSAGAARFVKPLASAGVAAILLAACDFAYMSWRISALEKEVSERSVLDAEIKSIRRAAGNAADEARRIRAGREKAAEAQEAAAAAREAYPRIMSAIASVCGGRTVVKSFSAPGPYEMRISAVAPDAASAASVMSRLTSEAAKAGWTLAPGGISAGSAAAGFSFVLKREGGAER